MHRNRLVVLILAFIVIAAIAFIFLPRAWKRHNYAVQSAKPYFVESVIGNEADSVQKAITISRNNAIVQAIRKVENSVVSISTVQLVRERLPWFDFFYSFGFNTERKYYGLGSGFIIDKRGYIVTNNHVIEDADVIKVTLTNGKAYEATVVGDDPEFDMAVLKIEPKEDLAIAELGDSGDLMVGEWVIAIGNPFGYLIKDSQPTVTVGVISATRRSFQKDDLKLSGLIQTDAAINPGNSGGPLVNSYGQVIGINTAIFSTTGGYQGVGFAIPVNTAKKIITALIDQGMVIKPWIGLEYQEINSDIISHLDLPVNEGVLVSYVVEESPAKKAGFMNGDIIAKIGDLKVDSVDRTIEIIDSLDIRQDAVFSIIRKKEFLDILIRPEIPDISGSAKKLLGITVQAPTPEAMVKYGISSYRKGVLIIQVEKKSPAHKADLKRGDLIIRMSREQNASARQFVIDQDIKNLKDFKNFVSDMHKGQAVRIILERKQELWRTYMTASTD